MAARSRRVGKALMDTCNLEAVLSDPGGGDLGMLVAPAMVRASAKGSASMRLQNMMFKAAVDVEILVFMKEFQAAFEAAQLGQRFRIVNLFPKNERRASDTLGFTDAQVFERFEKEKQAWDAALGDVERFKEMASTVFHADLGSAMIKAVTLMSQEDPHYTPTRVYAVGVATVHFYLAVGNGRCEVCNCTGTKCRRTGFTLVPSGHTTPRLLYCGQQCVEHRSVNLNMRSGISPFEGERTPKAVANNNTLLKHMLRHVGIPHPFSTPMLMKRMPQARFLTFDSPLKEWCHHVLPLAARSAARYWLEPHPTLPRDFSIVSHLHIPNRKAVMARKDMERGLKISQEVEAFVEQKRMERLLGDVDNLLEEKGIAGSGLNTVDDVDNMYPGVKRTIVRVLGPSAKAKGDTGDHALDSCTVRTVINIICLMVGPLRRHDQQLTGGICASPQAYTYVTGLCSGESPRSAVVDISTAISAGSALDIMDLQGWRTWVTAMHAFDAIQWDKLFVFQGSPSGGASGSSDPVDVENQPGWRLEIGGGGGSGMGGAVIKAFFSGSGSQAFYKDMSQSCSQRLDELDMEADFPTVPSQQSIDAFIMGTDRQEGFAMANFLEVVARTMAYHVETRAMALDILTANHTATFVSAVVEAGLDVEALAAEAVATRMDTAECP